MQDDKVNGPASPRTFDEEALPAGDGAVAISPDAEASPLLEIAAQRDRLLAENAELNDRLLRRAAEFDNYRKRVEKERQELIDYAANDAVKSLLPVLDNFERALAADGASKEYVRGMELIYNQLFDTLRKLGLEPIDSVGKPFDPYIHHAVEMVESAEADDQTVLADLQKGYHFKGRLLRPSLVKVAVKQA